MRSLPGEREYRPLFAVLQGFLKVACPPAGEVF